MHSYFHTTYQRLKSLKPCNLRCPALLFPHYLPEIEMRFLLLQEQKAMRFPHYLPEIEIVIGFESKAAVKDISTLPTRD